MTHVFKTPKGQVFIGGLGPWVALNAPNERKRTKEVKAAAERAASKFAVEYIRAKDGVSFVAALPANAPKAALRGAAAATVIAEMFPDDHVVYVEQLRDGRYWVVCTVKGELDPRYDTIGDTDETVDWLDNILNEGSGLVPRVLLNVRDDPPSNMLARADMHSADIASALDGIKVNNTHKVKQVAGVTAIQVVALGLVLLVLVGLGGGWWWMKEQEKAKRFAAQAAAAQEALALQQRIESETELRIITAVASSLQADTATPTPAPFVKGCLQVVDWLGPGVAGWRVVSIACDAVTGQVATVMLAPTDVLTGWPGTTESLMDFAKRHDVQASFDAASGGATLIVPIPGVGTREPMPLATLPRLMEIEERLPTRMQIERQANSSLQYSMTGALPVSLSYRDPHNEDAIKAAGGQVPMIPVPAERAYRRGTVNLSSQALWQLESMKIDWPYWTVRRLELFPREQGEYQWQLEAVYVAANS